MAALISSQQNTCGDVYRCTDKDRSAERDSPQCLTDKQSRLEKGVKYLLLLQAQTTSEDSAEGNYTSNPPLLDP